jgi:hypothetical protein
LRLKNHPRRTTVNSMTMSQRPRVSKNRLTSATVRPDVP